MQKRYGTYTILIATSALIAVGVLSCTTADPYRPEVKAAQGCNIDIQTGNLDAGAPRECTTANTEIAHGSGELDYDYTLHFVEFDDQGWRNNRVGDSGSQMDNVLNAIRDRLTPLQPEAGKPGTAIRKPALNVVVFVHGWKHNAAADDGNVASFRQMLREIATMEKHGAGSHRDVVGVYVGWRGKSLDLPEPWSNISFWDRKNTAAEVAQGSVREFLARLDAIADHANDAWLNPSREVQSSGREGPRLLAGSESQKVVRMMYVGHSFGGHILLTALGGSILKDLSTFDEQALRLGPTTTCNQNDSPRLDRDGDMVVLVNPAIEGTRFEPIFAATSKWREKCYHSPLLVAVTSEGDWATRLAFPAGRWLSTVFEDYGGNATQREADRTTFGHNSRYITHRLKTFEQYEMDRQNDSSLLPAPAPHAACADWDMPGRFIESVRSEYRNQQQFSKMLRQGHWDSRAARVFCAKTVLLPAAGNPGLNAPVLNIHTDADLIHDHNDIFKPRFVSFLRELYMDSQERAFAIK